eukprot:1162028-Pelagomonas_calceolata.AAC.6
MGLSNVGVINIALGRLGVSPNHLGKGDTLAQRAVGLPHQRARGKLVWVRLISGSMRPQGTRPGRGHDTSVDVLNHKGCLRNFKSDKLSKASSLKFSWPAQKSGKETCGNLSQCVYSSSFIVKYFWKNGH